MPLATEEQERLLEAQEWACPIFAAPGRARALARRQAEAAAAVIQSSSEDKWPNSEQTTAQLAMQLDSGPMRRRTTHALRSTVKEALSWADGAVSSRLSGCLANYAVALHTPTSAVRSLCKLARHHVSVWSAVREGTVPKSLALSGNERLLKDFCGEDSRATEEQILQWQEWLTKGFSDLEADDLGQHSSLDSRIPKEPNNLEAEELTHMRSLRAYQKAAVDAVGEALPENCCVVLPCGAGKTRVGAAIATEFLAANPAGCVVVLCLRREGVRQWSRELQENWEAAAYEAGRHSPGEHGELLRSAKIVLVTYHRMLSERRRAAKKLPCEEDGIGEGGSFDEGAGGSIAARFRAAAQGLLIADECHMVPAPKIGDLLKNLLAQKTKRLVGLTATLLRESGAPSEASDEGGEVPWPLLGRCVFRETFAALAPTYLAPVRCVEVSVPVAGPWRKLFKQPLTPAVCLSGGKWTVLEHLLAKHADDSLLITVERCEQARLIATMFGIIPLDGSVPAAQTKEYLERFRQRKILALVATHVLDDSADFPELSVMIQMGGHFASRRQEQQRLGRLLRWGPAKRQRWEANGARPTFYVLVHQDTVEADMSRHRTESVPGVEYERVSGNSLMGPGSVLGDGSSYYTDLFPVKKHCMHEVGPEDQAKLNDNLEKCVSLSERVANSLPGWRPGSNGSNIDEVRKWLQEKCDVEEVSSSSSEGASKAQKRGHECQDSESEDKSKSKSEDSSTSSDSSDSSSSLSTDSCGEPAQVASPKRKARRAPKAKAVTTKRAKTSTPRGGRGRGKGRGKGARNQNETLLGEVPEAREQAPLTTPASPPEQDAEARRDVNMTAPNSPLAPRERFGHLRPTAMDAIELDSD